MVNTMPTVLTFVQAKALKNRFINIMAESAVYTKWSNEFARQYVAEFIEKQRQLYDFDPYQMTLDELKELGFGQWDDNLYLVPLWLHPFLKSGVKLTDIGGGSMAVSYDEKGQCNIDNDTRFGMLAYGISECEALDPNAKLEPYGCTAPLCRNS